MKQLNPILDSIHTAYRGRIPSRIDGKNRRQKILSAVRKIIITQGIQGVKHRAVAEVASVPLAATTYYFPDIQALLHDAFLDFCERNIHQLQSLEAASQKLLHGYADQDALKTNDYQTIRDTLTELIFKHIQNQIANCDDRIIERTFRVETLRNPELLELVNAIEEQQLRAISQFLQALGSDNAESDSREVFALILFLEQGLIAAYITEKQALETIHRLLSRLIN